MRTAYTVRYAGPPGWRRIPPVTRGLLVATVVGYLGGILRVLPVDYLVATPAAIFPGFQLWRLLTYPFVNIGILGVLFDLLLIWSFGSELESQWGSRSFALFVATATVTAALLGIGTAFLLRSSGFGAGYGFAGPIIALIVAWMLEGPSLETSFFGIVPMTRKGFALLAIVIVAFSEIEQTRSIPRLVFVLGGLPVALLRARLPRRSILPASFRLPRPFRRRRFRVVKDEDPYRFH